LRGSEQADWPEGVLLAETEVYQTTELNPERNTSKVKDTCGEIEITETADVDGRAGKEAL
jgi:hypothetical protein